MEIVLDEQEQELSNILCVKDQDGRVRIMIGLLVTVFFENQLTRELREAVTDVAEDYIDRVREHLRWVVPLNAKREYPIDSAHGRLPREWLPSHPDGESWSFDFHGGGTAKEASAFHICGYGSKRLHDGGLGFLHVSFPLLWFAEGQSTFPSYVLALCQRIRPLSGYAGIGVVESHDGYEQDKYQPVVREFAERFPGLEVESRVAHNIHLRTGIKGVSWLTILGDHWLKEMGGLDYLRIRLDESFGFYPYDGGLIIQAGPKPQIGDVQANRWPQHYVTLAKVLKKIQVTNHYPFHFGGPGRMNHQASLAWLFRFDGK
jgi:hypothetical protein